MPSLEQCYRVQQRYSGHICAAIGVLPGEFCPTLLQSMAMRVSLSPLHVSSPLEEQPSQASAVQRTPLSPGAEHSGAPGWGFSACIHLKYRLCTQQLLNPVCSQEPRSYYKFSLEEQMCCARTTVLFLKILRKYFVPILALTSHQSDDTNLFYQEARQER